MDSVGRLTGAVFEDGPLGLANWDEAIPPYPLCSVAKGDEVANHVRIPTPLQLARRAGRLSQGGFKGLPLGEWVVGERKF